MLVGLVGDRARDELGAEFDLVEATTGGVSDPPDLFLDRGGGELGRVERRVPVAVARHQLDDVGLPGGDRQNLLATAADHDRRALAAGPGVGAPVRSLIR